MITPQRAYYIAKKKYPEAIFTKFCLDYHDNYVFPYTVKDPGNMGIGLYVFVTKETGELVVDLAFNVAELRNAIDLSNEVIW